MWPRNLLLLTSSAFLNKKLVYQQLGVFGRHRCLCSQSTHPVETAFRTNRAWRRLRHLVNLTTTATTSNSSSTDASRTVADVGTDHGLLAFGLASTGKFSKVTGVDQSERALRDGAHQLPKLPVLSFRHGDGLAALQPGEADIICIAGMGVHTMRTILGATDENGTLLLDALRPHQLVLQPTNSRPRNLYRLYAYLQNIGWQVDDERIEYLSKRWYITASFARTDDAALSLPGDKLVENSKLEHAPINDKMADDFWAWVSHHCAWIRKDQARGRHWMDKADLDWIARFSND